MADNAPIQVDYTSRDYESIRADLIERVRQRIPDWTGDDPSDFGLALIESFAYLGDLVSYYADRAANESSLSTATRRDNVIALAKDLGYTPSGYVSSTVVVTVTNSTGSALTLPAGTLLSATVNDGDSQQTVYFETQYDITVPADEPVDVVATQGQTIRGETGYGEYLGESDGTPNQTFTLAEPSLMLGTIAVFVYDGVNYLPWSRVDGFTEYNPLSRVFQAVDPGGSVSIRFGDGVSGMVPPRAHLIYATYRTTLGSKGNIPALDTTGWDLVSVPGLAPVDAAILSGSLTFNNDVAARGGIDPESTDSIRRLAPRAYRAANRAVTLEDYQSIAVGVTGCGKASAIQDGVFSVVVAVAPYRGQAPSDARPGYVYDEVSLTWSEGTELSSLRDRVSDRLSEVSLAGIQVAVVSPTYVPVFMGLSVLLQDGVKASDADTLIRQTLLSRFDYSNVDFQAVVYPSDLVSLVTSLGPLVKNVEVTRLNIVDAESEAVGQVEAQFDEILIIPGDGVELTLSGGIDDIGG